MKQFHSEQRMVCSWSNFFSLRSLLIIAVFLLNAEIGRGQIAAWQLNGATGNEVSKDANTIDANLNTATLTRSGGVTASALGNAYGSTNYTASGTRTDAVTNGRGQSFTISAKSGYKVSLSTLDARFRRSSTGPNAFVWQYSTDGVNFTSIGSDISYTLTTTGGDAQTQISLTAISALQNVASGTTITIRLIGWGASAITGTFAIGRSLTTGSSDYSLAVGGTVTSTTPLPVAMVSFSGMRVASRNILKWTTANEQNNTGFEVLRAIDGIHFSSIGFVGTLALNGNSNDLLHYTFIDDMPAGDKQYYQLRQVDIDGRSKTSRVVLIRGSNPGTITIDQLIPNPAKEKVNVILLSPGKDKIQMVITDLAGKMISQQINNVEAGSNTISVQTGGMATGTYLIQVISVSNGQRSVGKLIKQ